MKFNKNKAIKFLCVFVLIIAFSFIMICRDKHDRQTEDPGFYDSVSSESITTESDMPVDQSLITTESVDGGDATYDESITSSDDAVTSLTVYTIPYVMNSVFDAADKNWVGFKPDVFGLSYKMMYDDCEYIVGDINSDGYNDLFVKSVSSNEIYSILTVFDSNSGVICVYSAVDDDVKYFINNNHIVDSSGKKYCIDEDHYIIKRSNDADALTIDDSDYISLDVNRDYTLPVVDSNIWSQDMTTSCLLDSMETPTDDGVVKINGKSVLLFGNVNVTYAGDDLILRNGNSIYRDNVYVGSIYVYNIERDGYADLHEVVVGSGEEFSNEGKGSWYQMISSDNKCKFIAHGSYIIIIAVNNPGDYNRFDLY